MASETKQTKKAAKTLHRMQREQIQRARQIGTLRGKLEKRSRQLQTLEAKMARLERQAYGPGPDGKPVAASPKALRPARLIINPGSGSFAKTAESPERLVALLRTHGIQAEVYLKTSTKAVHAWVQEAVKQHEALVIAVGGDGTIEDVAVELVGSDTVLGILPTGTMNNLARELGIPLDIDQACALLGAGITRPIDVGQIRSNGKSAGNYFLETAGLGLAIAWPAGQNIKKGRWGKLPSAFRKMFEQNTKASETEPIQIELENGEKIETRVRLVTISNAPLYGLNNLVAPDAKMDDGLLDLAVYDGLNDVDLAGYFLNSAHGTRVSNPNVRFYRTRRVQIRSRQEMPATSDKDELPEQQVLDFELIPRAISMIVGQGSGLVWPVEAVASVPPLGGAQAQPKNDPAADQATPTNGIEHITAADSSPQPESSMVGAR
jgi:diacylglycerol kinase (ATP)